MERRINRNDYPPIIGTIEIVGFGKDGEPVPKEMPIIELFEIRGEQFALHLDIDYYGCDCDFDWADDVPGDVACTHVGTGFTVGWEWGSPDYIKAMTNKRWQEHGFCDLYELAKEKGAIPVRGTVIPVKPDEVTL